MNAVVLGISSDSVESHLRFAGNHRLPFTLLSDKNREVKEQYGVESRSSFLIDPQGIIFKAYARVDPETHAAEVLQDLKGR